jgi:hypothetical protein
MASQGSAFQAATTIRLYLSSYTEDNRLRLIAADIPQFHLVMVDMDATQQPASDCRHEPLDHSKAAIRLIHFQPELSPEGFVQCAITHIA